MTTEPTLLYSIESYEYLQRELGEVGHFDVGRVERTAFPDGERYRRLLTRPTGRDVAIVGGTVSDRDTLELYDLASAAVDNGAARLTLIIPFFGYSTMERASRPGEVVTAKARARMLSSIPTAATGNRVVLVDLHVAGVAHYFEGALRPFHLDARPVVERAARRLGGAEFVLACTDAGRAKWVESLAQDMGVTPAFVYKRRTGGGTTEVAGVSAHVRGRHVVIYDDMIRSGSSLLGAARAYHDAGATSVSAIATHGVFPGDSLAALERSGLLSGVVVTDTHPRAAWLRSDFLHVESVSQILIELVREIG